MNTKIYVILLVVLLAIIFISCDDTLINNQIDNIIIPSQNVSYDEYIQPLFTFKCNTSQCHNSADMAGGIDLTTWSGAIADPSVVFPFQPESSRLVWAVEGISGANPMPPIGAPVTPLTLNQVEGLKTWIKEGAEKN
ncbi:MAG: c-type cytochrome domain-containing protein [Melioribacteraceae bacterium]